MPGFAYHDAKYSDAQIRFQYRICHSEPQAKNLASHKGVRSFTAFSLSWTDSPGDDMLTLHLFLAQ